MGPDLRRWGVDSWIIPTLPHHIPSTFWACFILLHTRIRWASGLHGNSPYVPYALDPFTEVQGNHKSTRHPLWRLETVKLGGGHVQMSAPALQMKKQKWLVPKILCPTLLPINVASFCRASRKPFVFLSFADAVVKGWPKCERVPSCGPNPSQLDSSKTIVNREHHFVLEMCLD